MQVTIHHYFHTDNKDDTKVLLNRILTELAIIKGDVKTMALDLTALEIAVNNETTVEAGVITALNGISAKLTDLQAQLAAAIAANDPAATAAAQAKLDAFTASINTSSAALAAAVANVPA